MSDLSQKLPGEEWKTTKLQDSSKQALFSSLKETLLLWTQEFSNTVSWLLYWDTIKGITDKNQISIGLEKREKALQNQRK